MKKDDINFMKNKFLPSNKDIAKTAELEDVEEEEEPEDEQPGKPAVIKPSATAQINKSNIYIDSEQIEKMLQEMKEAKEAKQTKEAR